MEKVYINSKQGMPRLNAASHKNAGKDMVNSMTADQVRGVVFQNSAIGGYKKADVDLFLEEVAVCIESMTAKIRALEKAKFDAGQKPTPAASEKPQEVVSEKPQEVVEIKPEPRQEQIHINSEIGISDNGLQSLLIRTQKLAEQIEYEARSAAEELLNKSAEDAKDIIARADSQAEDTIEKANAILAEAERKEASISAAARAEAENIINEAVARSGQMLTATREKLKAEQEMCEKLRLEFSQVRNVIVGFYEEQLEELRGIDLDSVAKEPVIIDEEPHDVELNLDSSEEETEAEPVDISSVSSELAEKIAEETAEEAAEETEIQFDLSSFSE